MNVNVNTKKIVIIAVVALIVGGSGWWWNSTKDERQAKATYEQLIDFANRQAVEIAVIEQAEILQQLKQMLTTAQQEQKQALEQSVQNPVVPEQE